MPYTKDNPPSAIRGLPEHAKNIWVSAFNAAFGGTCEKSEDKEACAHKIAWSAVKRAGYSKRGDSWVKDSGAVVTEFSMHIAKAPMSNGKMRVHMTASDTDPDLYDQEMSLDLFNNFIRRSKEQVPEAFQSLACDDGWCGGMPYLSIAHYRTGGGRNVPGMPDELYVDGNRFKSNATLHDSPIGRAVYKSLRADLEGKSLYDERVRISIGFIDLKHSHGDLVFERKDLTSICPLCENGIGNKKYLDGYLVHMAFTRVPVNPRTSAEVLMAKGDIKTKKDDAASIVGEDEAVGLVEDSLTANGALVVKAKDMHDCKDCPDEEDPADTKDKKKKTGYTSKADTEAIMPENEIVTPTPIPETPDEMDTAYAVLRSKVKAIKQLSLNGEDALRMLQPDFDGLANVVRSQFPAPARTQEQGTADIAAAVKAAVAEAIPQIVPQIVSQTVAEVTKSMTTKTPATPNQEVQHVPAPRSVPAPKVNLSQVPAEHSNKPKSQFAQLARRSVGLKD